jgi:hypothetical protein
MTTEEIASLVRQSFAGQSSEFRPCAYWDDSLDCIRILTRDCSITETRVNKLLTVLEATYPELAGRKCVGFTIKGAQHFCQQQGLSLATPITLSQLLDAIIAACPDTVVEAFVDHVARPLVRDAKIEKVESFTEGDLVTAN